VCGVGVRVCKKENGKSLGCSFCVLSVPSYFLVAFSHTVFW